MRITILFQLYCLVLLSPWLSSAQTTDFVDSLFNLYPKSPPYPEDVNFEMEADSTISVVINDEQCSFQRWLHYPGITLLMSYRPDDCAATTPALKSVAINGQSFLIENYSFYQNEHSFAANLSWYADEALHKLTLNGINWYYTHFTLSRCNGTMCSFSLTAIFKEQNNQFTPYFFFNPGPYLEIIDVDQDGFLDIVEIAHTDETTGSFSSQNNRTDIKWLEYSPNGKFVWVKDNEPFQISIRYPGCKIETIQVLKYHWPD